MKKVSLCFFILIVFISCGTSKYSSQKNLLNILNTEVSQNQFTGILVIDPATKDTIFKHNSNKYFTPASNTKIFTLYTALQHLDKNLPSLKYVLKNNILYIKGTADPTLLHPYFKDSTVINFLKRHKNISLLNNTFKDTKFGPGWAWEDYEYSFSPERSALPLYGNVVHIKPSSSFITNPSYFNNSIHITSNNSLPNREIHKNSFFFNGKYAVKIPYITSTRLTKTLLEEVVHVKISETATFPTNNIQTLYNNTPTDSIYKYMMHESDNFLAEQLLLLSAGVLSDTLKSSIAIQHTLNNSLKDLKQKPRWVDGSGLSRYNLFTPESMVYVLQKLRQKISQKRLFTLFPSVSNTTKPGIKKEDSIFAKSGSMGNTYCLSGYLLTNSGKVLLFSFMNNHFQSSSKQVKNQMFTFLNQLKENY